MSRYMYRFALLFLQLILCFSPTLAENKNDDGFIVAGYLPDYRFYLDLNKTVVKLTDLYVFSTDFDIHAKDSKMLSDENESVCCLNKDHFEKVKEATAYRKEYYPDGLPPLRVWLTVGGAGRGKGLQTLLKGDKMDFGKIILHLLKKCIQYDLYGIDFDNQVFGQDDMMQYVLFLNQAVQVFRKYEKKVSITMRPGIWIPSLATTVVDRVNLMAYDGPFAKLEENVKPAVKGAIQAGVPPSKIVLGYPAYARSERNPNEVKTFSEIYDEIEKSGNPQDVEGIDERSLWDGFVIDSPAAVREKAQYANDMGLKGIFMWELGQDKQHEAFAPSGFLLEASSTFAALPDPFQVDDRDESRDEL